ncbi:MAG: hypothetical protein U0556_15775 [Dehalococcoidia bacterium]
MTEQVRRPVNRQRPRVVTWVAILHIIQGLVLLPVGPIVLLYAYQESGLNITAENREYVYYGLLLTTFGLLAFPIAVGLLRLRSWGWTLAMALQGILLGTALVQSYFGDDDFLTLALGAFVVLCLNQQEVRAAFGVGASRDDPR